MGESHEAQRSMSDPSLPLAERLLSLAAPHSARRGGGKIPALLSLLLGFCVAVLLSQVTSTRDEHGQRLAVQQPGITMAWAPPAAAAGAKRGTLPVHGWQSGSQPLRAWQHALCLRKKVGISSAATPLLKLRTRLMRDLCTDGARGGVKVAAEENAPVEAEAADAFYDDFTVPLDAPAFWETSEREDESVENRTKREIEAMEMFAIKEELRDKHIYNGGIFDKEELVQMLLDERMGRMPPPEFFEEQEYDEEELQIIEDVEKGRPEPWELLDEMDLENPDLSELDPEEKEVYELANAILKDSKPEPAPQPPPAVDYGFKPDEPPTEVVPTEVIPTEVVPPETQAASYLEAYRQKERAQEGREEPEA